MKKQKVIAVCGIKNSGKTTLIERLVSYLTEHGQKVAVIKHDGHDFSCDIPGTDSYRMTQAGAYGTAVYSDHRIFVHKVGTGERETELMTLFPEADIIILEGMKDSAYPKIEVIREGISSKPASNPEGRFLIATNRDRAEYMEKTAHLDDIETIAGEVLKR
jgi:molybdopterin-guanine dinucleotide biosynthesis protein B